MPLTVVVLPAVWTGVLPAAAVPALRAATVVLADDTVPADVRTAIGADRLRHVAYRPLTPTVVLTTDPANSLVPVADAVVTAAEPAGLALLDAVAVMDRLRSPGGCPWDAEQTHLSLLQYLVEECYELHEAIEDGDRTAVCEELGDVLLQVLFHARVASDDPVPFGIDEVAAGLVAKLVGRHPHVFAGPGSAVEQVDTAERQQHRWEELKRSEKRRGSSVDGVPLGQPAVALAAKLAGRTARAGLPADLLPAGDDIGERLFALAARAKRDGADPELELRASARRFADDVRSAQRAAEAAGADPHSLDAAAWRRYWPR